MVARVLFLAYFLNVAINYARQGSKEVESSRISLINETNMGTVASDEEESDRKNKGVLDKSTLATFAFLILELAAFLVTRISEEVIGLNGGEINQTGD